jgi:gamma-glutamyltranspeptidase/glutathione hydrolase
MTVAKEAKRETKLNKKNTSKISQQGSYKQARRQWVGALGLLFLSLSACSEKPAVGNVGHIAGFAGAVVADEPRAVLVGSDILSSGGSAADAAVAMYFTLAATMPHAVGIGGGGACVVHSNAKNTTEALDFMPRAAASGKFAVPSAPRGLYALHAKYGRLRWSAILSNAENLSRFGNQVSRALAVELANITPIISKNNELIRLYTEGNRTLQEGEKLTQPELAGLIGRLRNKGVGELYGGLLAREIEKASQGGITLEDLRGVSPTWSSGARIQFGNETAVFPANSPAAQALVSAVDGKLSGTVSAIESPANVPAVGFAVADKDGSMVACIATMGKAFGSGAFLREQGMMLASPLAGQTNATPLLIIKHHVNESVFAGTASGADGIRAIVEGARLTRLGKKTAANSAETLGGEKLGIIHCPEGLPPYPRSCEIGFDPKNSGYARIVAGKI